MKRHQTPHYPQTNQKYGNIRRLRCGNACGITSRQTLKPLCNPSSSRLVMMD
ncbi:hypothetical protein EMCG_01863 [[Emmonsia] crescens]|uniref:Uncharacterized protein n=1 Tax=[Emmonsia] crescens TaxID=73230 RepID=A0A0G2I118_9EURO|nr:hypothetical protein EMCG_01863 [Emmonsia crescens UAMH 3008]